MAVGVGLPLTLKWNPKLFVVLTIELEEVFIAGICVIVGDKEQAVKGCGVIRLEGEGLFITALRFRQPSLMMEDIGKGVPGDSKIRHCSQCLPAMVLCLC